MLKPPLRLAFLVDGLIAHYQHRLFTGARRAARKRGAQLVSFQGAFLKRVETEAARFDASFVYDLAAADAVDGVIPVSSVLANTIGLEHVLRICERSQLPCVSIGEVPGLAHVGIAPHKGLRAVIRHLAEVHGRRRIGFVRGNPTSTESREREQIFRETLQELGLELSEQRIVQGNFLETSGHSAVRTLLDERGLDLDELDALVSANDQMAAGAALELARRGIRVPEDIALVGFDDDDYARGMSPQLTTVAQPIEELGERAVHLLLDCIEGRAIEPRTLLETAPVLRGSCGCRPPRQSIAPQVATPEPACGADKSDTIERLHVIQRVTATRALGSALAYAKDLKALARVLEGTLGGLGVHYCDVCLFVRGSEARAVKLIAHFADDSPGSVELPHDAGELWRALPSSTPAYTHSKASVVFPTANLLHELDRAEGSPFDVLVYPLVFAEAALGYVAYDAPRSVDDTWLLESIASHVSSAVNALARDQELTQAREAAERANASKGEFVAMMSHEVRTPLNAVLGHLDLVLQTTLSAEQRRHTSRAQAAARTLLEIVNDLLDFSKIEAQRLDLERIALNLDQVLCQVSSACALHATRKNLEFVIDVDPQTPRDLFGDPLRLTQVLLNLLGNAIKFSDKGHVVLRVEPEHLDLPGSARLRFEIEDTGIGLDAQQKTLIFEPFVQGDSTMSRRYGGTGLGLAICKRLVELMGGSLSVESEPQRGSVFSFSLNFDGVVSGPTLEPWGLGTRILLLEPSAQQARALSRLLEAHAANVDVRGDAKSAVQAFEDQRCQGAGFDLVLLDESAADPEGDFAALLARAADSGTPHALLRSAGATTLGDTPGLSKPWDASTLTELLAQLLGEPRRLAAPPAPQLRQEPLHGKRILVVQDATTLRELASELLLAAGAEVLGAADGEAALRIAAGRQLDLIMMDLTLPDLDGHETTARIRSLPGHAATPVLLLTASIDQEQLARAYRNGMLPCASLSSPSQFLADVARALQLPTTRRLRSSHPQLEPLATSTGELDVEGTLLRLDGNFEMFRRLLKRFLTSHEHSVRDIAHAVARRDYQQARLLTHTLNGSAAAIGARRLPGIARALELLLQREGPELDDPLQELEQSLTSTVAAIQHALATTRSRVSGTFPALALRVAAERLRGLISAHDTDAVEAFELLRTLVTNHEGSGDRLMQLEARINAYDFEAAKSELASLLPSFLEPPAP